MCSTLSFDCTLYLFDIQPQTTFWSISTFYIILLMELRLRLIRSYMCVLSLASPIILDMTTKILKQRPTPVHTHVVPSLYSLYCIWTYFSLVKCSLFTSHFHSCIQWHTFTLILELNPLPNPPWRKYKYHFLRLRCSVQTHSRAKNIITHATDILYHAHSYTHSKSSTRKFPSRLLPCSAVISN